MLSLSPVGSSRARVERVKKRWCQRLEARAEAQSWQSWAQWQRIQSVEGGERMDGPGVSTRARVVRVVRLGLGRVGLCSRFHSQALQALIGPGRCQIDEEPDQGHTSRPLNGLVVFGEAPAPVYSLVLEYGEVPYYGCTFWGGAGVCAMQSDAEGSRDSPMPQPGRLPGLISTLQDRTARAGNRTPAESIRLNRRQKAIG